MDLFAEFDKYFSSVKNNDLKSVINEHRPEFLHKLDRNDLTPFHYACKHGIIDVVKFLLSKNVDIEFPSPMNGWRALHWAVGSGHDRIGKLLIEHGADKEAKASRGLRPLHCAANEDHYVALRMLLASGVHFYSKNDRNETAWQLAYDRESYESINVFNKWLSYEKIFNLVRQNNFDAFKEAFIKERVLVKENNTQLTVLDVAVNSKAHDCLEFVFLENIDEQTVYDGLATTLTALVIPLEQFKSQFHLYRSILFDNKDEFIQNATVWNVNQPWPLTGESYLEMCCRHKRSLCIGPILQILIDVDESWNRAIGIANANGSCKIAQVISSRKNYISSRINASYNRLHIAVQDNNVEVIKYILDNQLIDPNEGDDMLGTPLCLALSLGHGNSVLTLRQYNIEFNRTPLHIALVKRIMNSAFAFFKQNALVDQKDCYGSTPLRLTLTSKVKQDISFLVEKGADIFMPVQVQKISKVHHNDILNKINRYNRKYCQVASTVNNVEAPVTFFLKLHRTILPSMLAEINYQTYNYINDDGDSLLHLSAKLFVPDITQQLIEKGIAVNIVNQKGNTPLHSAFIESTENCWEMEGFIETVQTLINYQADINYLNAEGVSVFQCAMRTNSRNTLNVILSQCQQVNIEAEDILELYRRQWAETLKVVLDLQEHEFKRIFLLKCIINSQLELIEFILELVGERFVMSIVEESLFTAAKNQDDEIFEKLLQYQITTPNLLQNGETLLTNLILNSSERFPLKLCKTDNYQCLYEMKNQNSQTPLHAAASKVYLKVFKYLILECQNLNEQLYGRTAVEMLMENMCDSNDSKTIDKLETIMKTIIKQIPSHENGSVPNFISMCRNVHLKGKLERFYLKNKKEMHVNEQLDEDKYSCEICLSDKMDCMLECGHPFCQKCVSRVENCPKCRRKKTKIHKLYLP